MSTNTPTTDFPTFERVKERVAEAYREQLKIDGPFQLHYLNGLTEMIIIEREMKDAETCLRHQRRRFEGAACRDCWREFQSHRSLAA